MEVKESNWFLAANNSSAECTPGKDNDACGSHKQCVKKLDDKQYHCVCKPGYVLKGDSCEGINEQITYQCELRQRAYYAEEIWKRSFISTVGPTVHTNLSRKRSFSKTPLKPEKVWTVKRSFSKKICNRDNLVISLPKFSSKSWTTNPKWSVIVAFLNFSGTLWTENNGFQSETAVWTERELKVLENESRVGS